MTPEEAQIINAVVNEIAPYLIFTIAIIVGAIIMK